MSPTLPPFVQELLDRRIDPLTDERSRHWLLEHPESLESFAALRQRLADAGGTPAVRATRAVRARLVAAAAVVFALGAVTVALLRPDAPAPSPLPRPDFAADGGVVFCRVTTSERAGTRGNRRIFEFHGAHGAAAPTLDRRSRSTLATFVHLPGPTTAWSVVRLTDSKAMLP